MRCEFSAAHYGETIERAKSTYDLLLFREWRPAGGRPRLFLRHDLDHSLRVALRMAELECERGVRATYFVQLHANLYNAVSNDATAMLREIVAMGHEVGLHYDTAYYAQLGAAPLAALSSDIEQLSALAGVPVESVSRHSPVDSTPLPDIATVAQHDAYSDRFARDVKYLSDSNRCWREGCVCRHLERGSDLQVLVHPIWWVAPGRTMREQILHVAATESAGLTAAATRMADYYEDCLAKRAELDRRVAMSGLSAE